ncbi:unnamed protein product [Dicrocoelium dendriticum]|nr:unnamed protein product [Dicrocoelium dendriticum]
MLADDNFSISVTPKDVLYIMFPKHILDFCLVLTWAQFKKLITKLIFSILILLYMPQYLIFW